jgi:eukaryotic-like serine/threonine-protein kinase
VEKNVVMGQKPTPGTQVKSGKQVMLWVSKGTVLDKVDNYVGRNLDDVRIDLQALFSTQKANIVIKEPILFQYDKSVGAGTIIAQKPKAGTAITGLTYLELVVSRGSGESMVEVGDYKDKSFTEVLSELTRSNIPFAFTARKAAKGEKPGIVVSQTPNPKTPLNYGQPVRMEMTIPANPGTGKIFGIFKYSLPDYPILMDIRLDVVSESGKGTLLEMKHPGGMLAIPYIVQENSDLTLYVMGKEQTQEKSRALGE